MNIALLLLAGIAVAYLLQSKLPARDQQGLLQRYPGEVGILRESSSSCNGSCHFKRGEVSVMFRTATKKEAALEIIARLGYRIAPSSAWSVKSTVVAVPKGKEGAAIDRLRKEPLVEFAGYNYIRDISSNNVY